MVLSVRQKDQGDPVLNPPMGLSPQDHPPCQAGRLGHFTDEDTEAQEEKGLGQGHPVIYLFFGFTLCYQTDSIFISLVKNANHLI